MAINFAKRGRSRIAAIARRTWNHRFEFTRIVRIRQLRWLDRGLFVPLGASPRLLSTEVRRSAIWNGIHPPDRWFRRLQSWLWQRHSARQAGVAALLCLAALIAIAAILPQLCPMKPGASDTATLNTLAQVAGGIFATIVTVVVFAIGLVAQRPDGGWAYMPFVARRHHVFLAASVSAAVALANSIMPILTPLGEEAIRAMLCVNVLVLPAIGILTLVLMCKVIESASGSDILSTLPVFSAAMARIAADDKHDEQMISVFAANLAGTRMQISPWAGLYARNNQVDHRYLGPSSAAHVLDIDLTVFREVRALVASLSPELEWSFLTAPASPSDDQGLVFVRLRSRSDGQTVETEGDSKAPKPPTLSDQLSDATADRLSALLHRMVIFGPKRRQARDMHQFFQRLEADLLRLARTGDSILLKKRLAEYQTLLQTWLEIAGPEASVPERVVLPWRDQPFAGPLEIDIYDLVREASRSNPETFAEVVDTIALILRDSQSGGRDTLYRDAARMFGFAAHTAINNPVLRDSAQELFDRWLNAIAGSLRSLHYRYDSRTASETKDLFAREQPYIDAFVGAALSMISSSLQAGDVRFASMVATRITHDMEERHRTYGASAPAGETGKTILEYTVLVAFAWAVHLLSQQHRNAAASTHLLRLLAPILPARHELIGLWELYHGEVRIRAAIDSRLGLDRWELRDGKMRVGFAYASGGTEWLPQGLYAALLAARQPDELETRNYFTLPPRRHLWDVQALGERLTRAAEHLPTLAAASRSEAITEVTALITQRHRVGEATALRAMATEPLSPDRVETLRRGVADGLDKHRQWPRLIKELGGLTRPALACLVQTRLKAGVHRDSLIAENNWGDGYGQMLAEDIAHREAMAIVHAVEVARDFDGAVESLISLPAAIRAARQSLLDAGHTPNLLVLPPFDRFPCAIFDMPLWQVPKQKDFGMVVIGEWEGMTVARCPYTNTESVIIADSAIAFGASQSTQNALDFSQTDADDAAKQKFLAQASDTGSEPLPTSNDLRVDTYISATSPVGPGDMKAVRRLDVRESDACYAMVPDEPEYHRPTCELLEHTEDIKCSLSKHLDGEANDRVPCTQCKPDRWDLEARLAARTPPTS